MNLVKTQFAIPLLLLQLGIASAQKLSFGKEEKIESLIQKSMHSFQIPGLAIGIVENNKIVYAKGFGVKNLNTNEPVTTGSLFHMASVSKPFSATSIMQLVEQGNMDLDAPVVRYLSYFKIDDERYKDITVRQMLGHISGMPDVRDYQWDKPEYDDGALERYVRSLGNRQLNALPGEKFSYSNMAFEVLGDLIAKVSGITLEEYVKNNILDPLEMKESTFLRKKVNPGLATTPHRRKLEAIVSEVYPYHRAHAPSSTLHSNVLEMCNWAIVNMNKGLFKGKRILEPKSYDMLWKPANLNNGTSAPVGLSWFIRNFRGNLMISHSGGDVGYRTNFVMLPEKSTGVVVLSNCDFTPIGGITNAVLAVMLEFEYRLPKTPVSFLIGRTILENNIESAIGKYHDLRNKHPDEYNFDTSQLNALGYQLIQLERIKEAIEIFKLNIEVHPEYTNGYDSLGESYLMDGNTDRAIQYYKKALGWIPLCKMPLMR